jgi:hypothetical protein
VSVLKRFADRLFSAIHQNKRSIETRRKGKDRVREEKRKNKKKNDNDEK